MDWIRNQSSVYWIIFAVSFLGIALWETVRFRREPSGPRGMRWANHSLLWIAGAILSTVLLGVSPVIVAISVQESGFGLLNQLWLPFSLRCLLAILLLDLTKYVAHRLWHSLPILWRVHAVHHSDPEVDLSTSFRFHPIELVVTEGAYLAVIALLAPPPLAVLALVLSRAFLGFFSHANASLPLWLEKPVRWIFVTPDMHRVHHSIEEREQGRNFGDSFSFWDRLFHTYVPEPAAGQAAMVTGLCGFESETSLGLTFMLAQPFRHEPREEAGPPPPTATAHQRF